MSDRHPSPFDAFGDDFITAHVADGERLHGYDIHADLAAHYRFSETQFLLITGELPDAEQARRFELGLHMLCHGLTIADASVHAARVVRHVHSRGDAASVAATAAMAVAEHCRYLLQTHADWLAWWADGAKTTAPPVPTDGAEIAARYAELPEAGLGDIGPAGIVAAALAVLYRSGLTSQHQLVTAMVLTRFPIAMAEAFAPDKPGLWAYPLNLPFWDYQGEQE